jgi:hypothetical protein
MIYPQLILLFLILLNVINHICNHDAERPIYNGPMAFLDAVLTIALLYFGGFFDHLLRYGIHPTQIPLL